MECRFVPEIDLFVCFHFFISSSPSSLVLVCASAIFVYLFCFILFGFSFVCFCVLCVWVCMCVFVVIRKSLTKAFIYLRFKIFIFEMLSVRFLCYAYQTKRQSYNHYGRLTGVHSSHLR